MTAYRLVSFKACPWVQRAAIVLREKGVAFELVHIESGARPDWFKPISPHGKVPVLQIDENTALFESSAIAEYLDETIAPRLAPEDPVARAINRAWTDFVPTFSTALGAFTGAVDAAALAIGREALVPIFARIEEALVKQSPDGPFFNGADFALVDAGFAPFLQRYLIGAELARDTLIHDYPRLARWAAALVARPSTHTFPPEEFRALYLQGVKRRGGFLAREVEAA
ncbi:MAG: glutathione S-transferase-like protein [Novosphingobium sp.]|nr:glutathione S-transferase-like protein [Novosphingobium sp.]